MGTDSSHLSKWKEETTAFERVYSVVTTIEEPANASYIAKEAAVSENTARSHLDLLVEMGIAIAEQDGGETIYKPDQLYLCLSSVQEKLRSNTVKELQIEQGNVLEQIEKYKLEYDVSKPSELREKYDSDSVSTQEHREAFKAASNWEMLEWEVEILDLAIEVSSRDMYRYLNQWQS
jgi:predicted ArsR family transcriptional regulator